MKMKQHIKSFGIVLAGVLAIAALAVSCSIMWPIEREVLCTNQAILFPMHRGKFLGQITTLGLGLTAWLAMFFEIFYGSSKETAKQWKEKIFPVILIITGLLVTATLAVVLGNVTGGLSPDFISACKPSEASWGNACRYDFYGTGIEYIYAKPNCTTDWRSWVPARSSLFPRYISVLSYSTATWYCWMLWRPFSSTMFPKLAILIPIGFPWFIGIQALSELTADMSDVLSGYFIGGLVAWIVMGWLLPALYPFIYESELPQHWNDGISLESFGNLGSNPDLKKASADPAKPPLPIIR